MANPKLTINKSSSLNYAAVGDTVTYNVSIQNTGNIDILNANINDFFSNGLNPVVGSVVINSKPNPTASLVSGINIPLIKVNQIINLSYQAVIISAGDITNQVKVIYEYNLVPNGTILYGDDISNINHINSSLPQIEVSKVGNLDFAMIGDNIEYTVTLKNKGQLDASNVFFTDKLQRNVNLVPDSFSVNGTIINSVDLNKGVYIGSLQVGQKLIVNYKVKVVSSYCNSKITNEAQVVFSYTLADGRMGRSYSKTGGGSMSIIDIGISNFKQLNIEEYLMMPPQKPDIEDINNVDGSIDIVKCHVVKTSNANSVEGQMLSGYKLIVHGVLKLVVEYTACEETQSVHSASYNIPFSTYIVLPQDYIVGSKLDINSDIEDIYSKIVDCRTFFINTTALINVKILSC